MKSFGEISNMETEGHRRYAAKMITNRTQPSILNNEGSNSDKNSSKPEKDTQRLYVKQFFDHFFEKKSMLEVITQIGNAVHVFQTLITDFENENGLIPDNKLHFQTRNALNGPFSNVIEREGNQISEIIQDLYQRLEGIFQKFREKQKQIETSPKSMREKEQHGDEQLYEMLNDYKHENKKQKQLKKKAEGECIELRRTLTKLEDQKLKINQLYKESEMQVNLLNKKRIELQSKIDHLKDELNIHISQKEQLSEKLSQLFQINQNLNSTERQNMQLKEQLRNSIERQTQLTKKFDNLEIIVSQRIKQKDEKWIAMIQEKLTSKALFQNASCSSFRQFMSAVQPLNKC